MASDGTNFVEQAKEARNRGVVAFTRFCDDKAYYKSHFFCFFEGEDYKYYCPRIEKYANLESASIVSYPCKGRNQVLKTYHLINKDPIYSDVKMAFFIDHDFEPLEQHENMYITPCYSIENFYTTLASFSKILLREFNLNETELDYSKCLSHYQESQHAFHQEMLLLNSWIYCQRQLETSKENRLNLNNFKIRRLFDYINIDGLQVKNPIDLALIKNEFPSLPEIQVDQLEKAKTILQEKGMQLSFRGKFEMEFLKNIIEDLKNKNRRRTYFARHIECVYLDVNCSAISSLSDYADTPDCLIRFLQKYRVS